MPELPEVETVRRGLEAPLVGHRLARVLQRRPDLRWPLPADFAARLAGRTVTRLDRRAKFILAHLDDGAVWMTHLGMSGRMFIEDGDARVPGPHDHIVIETDGGITITYQDHRRFGMMDLVPAAGLEAHRLLKDLGPEPLGNAFQRDSPFNVGMVYRPFEWLEVSGAFERGNTAMFRAALRGNLHDAGLPKFDDPPQKVKVRPRVNQDATRPARFDPLQRNEVAVIEPGAPVPVTPRPRGEQNAGEAGSIHQRIADRLFDGMRAHGVDIETVEFDDNETRVYLADGTDGPAPQDLTEAAGLVARTLQVETERVRFIHRSRDTARGDVTVTQAEMQRAMERNETVRGVRWDKALQISSLISDMQREAYSPVVDGEEVRRRS